MGRGLRLLLLAFLPGLCACRAAPPPPPEYPPYRLPSGLFVQDLVFPQDHPRASWGDAVTLDYTMSLEDGSVADSSRERGQPICFTLGSGSVPRGLEEGLVGMPLKGRRRLTVPPELGYGEAGRPPRIPPNATLRIEVELLEIAPSR